MGKLRLIGNQLLSGVYKTSKIGAHASSYSWQMKIWNSGPKVSTGMGKTDLWSLGVRAQDDSRGEAEWRVEEQFPCILALAPSHRPSLMELGFHQADTKSKVSVLSVLCETSTRWLIQWDTEVIETWPCCKEPTPKGGDWHVNRS